MDKQQLLEKRANLMAQRELLKGYHDTFHDIHEINNQIRAIEVYLENAPKQQGKDID